MQCVELLSDKKKYIKRIPYNRNHALFFRAINFLVIDLIDVVCVCVHMLVIHVCKSNESIPSGTIRLLFFSLLLLLIWMQKKRIFFVRYFTILQKKNARAIC